MCQSESQKGGEDHIQDNSTQTINKLLLEEKPRKIFVCAYCNREFRTKGNLSSHMKTHTGEKPFVCNFENCDKKFSTSGNLKNHMATHYDYMRIKCTEEGCDKTFISKSHLKTHLRTHLGKKPYQCKECGKEFNEKGNLKIHERIHSGERPFRCNFKGCEHSFKTKAHLNDHINSHKNNKPFICDICKCCFGRKSSLKNHKIKVHKKKNIFACEVKGCKKVLISPWDISFHKNYHKNEICEDSLDRKNLLNCFDMDFNRVDGNYFMNQEHFSEDFKFNILNSNSLHYDKKIHDERHKDSHHEHNRYEECQHQHDTLCNNINFFDCNISSASESMLILPHEHDSPFLNPSEIKNDIRNI